MRDHRGRRQKASEPARAPPAVQQVRVMIDDVDDDEFTAQFSRSCVIEEPRTTGGSGTMRPSLLRCLQPIRWSMYMWRDSGPIDASCNWVDLLQVSSVQFSLCAVNSSFGRHTFRTPDSELQFSSVHGLWTNLNWSCLHHWLGHVSSNHITRTGVRELCDLVSLFITGPCVVEEPRTSGTPRGSISGESITGAQRRVSVLSTDDEDALWNRLTHQGAAPIRLRSLIYTITLSASSQRCRQNVEDFSCYRDVVWPTRGSSGAWADIYDALLINCHHVETGSRVSLLSSHEEDASWPVWLTRGKHGFDAASYTQTDPPGAAPERGRSLISEDASWNKDEHYAMMPMYQSFI